MATDKRRVPTLRSARRHLDRARVATMALALAVTAACSDDTLPVGATGGGVAAGGIPTTTLAGAGATVPGSGSDVTGGAGVTQPGGTPGTPGVTTSFPPTTTPPGGSERNPQARPGSRVGVTDGSITLSFTGPFSGPYGQFVEKVYKNGIEVWQKEVNSNGGIHGRQVVIKKVDNQMTAEGGVAACKEASSNGSFMVLLGFGLPNENDCLDAAGIPVLDASAAALKPSWKTVLPFEYLPAYSPAVASFLKSPYMNAGSKKIGIVYTGDNLQLSAEYEALRGELARQGLDLVHSEKVSTGQASFVSEMSRMRNAGAETVLLVTLLESPGIVRDAHALGYRPQWFAGTLSASGDVVSKAGAAGYQGIRGLRAATTTETPAYAAYLEKVKKYAGEAAARGADPNDAHAYSVAATIGVVFQGAGRDMTRESFLASARSMEPFDSGLHGPVTWRGREVGLLSLFPVECCKSDSSFRLLGPAQERF